MSKKAPNKYFAPIIIAGITVGFFVSAYKFVFARAKQAHKQVKRDYSVDKSQESENEKIAKK